MPTYTYYCNKCEEKFEIFFYIADYQSCPKCILCKSKQTERSYQDDISSVSASVKKHDSELKTLGDIADRNRDKLSNDHKAYLHNQHNSYKHIESDKKLPSGMSRIKKPPKTKWT